MGAKIEIIHLIILNWFSTFNSGDCVFLENISDIVFQKILERRKNDIFLKIFKKWGNDEDLPSTYYAEH